jgi:SAM-dependent methyltransferase
MQPEWYEQWFDSPYYHVLYGNRSETEAEDFIGRLCERLKLPEGARVWDVACGKGRHAIAFSRRGYDVTGTDLSAYSISQANKTAHSKLRFFVHDMRREFLQGPFNAAFNLFTSIGYFTDNNDNYLVFRNITEALVREGCFVVDFFNATRVENHLVADSVLERGGITFKINKLLVNGFINKKITFTDHDQDLMFEESVALLKKSDFENFAEASGLYLEDVYGSYKLEPFEETNSERLIMIFRKK